MNVTISLGTLDIENLYLFTQTGYIYDIQLQLSYLLVTDNNFSSTFNNPKVTLIANPMNNQLSVSSINASAI